MSIDRTDYIVYGWKLPYDMKDSKGQEIDFWDEKFIPMIEGHKGEEYSLIIDQMMGEYIVFGKVIAEDDEGWNFTYLTNIVQDSEKLMNKYREVFNVSGRISEPYLFIFTHYH